MLSFSPVHAAKRCVASLATAGLLIAGFAGSAAAATVGGDSTMAPAASSSPASPAPMSSSDMTQSDMFPSERANDPCTNITAITTRPTVTNSVCVVPKGHALLEAGYSAVKDQDSGTNTYSYPQASLRFGTNIKNLEISVTGPSEERVKGSNGQSIHALGDSAVGAKYFLGNSKKFAHSVSVGMSIPTGDNGNTTNSNTLNAAYNAQYALNKVFGLQATENFISNAFKPAATPTSGNPPTYRYGSFVSSLVLSAAVPKIANVFVEDAVYSKNLGNGTNANQFLAGASKPISNRVQIDAEYVTSNQHYLSGPNTKAHGFGAGLSFYL